MYLSLMARTTRKYLTSRNYREARKGRQDDRRKSGTRTADLIEAGFVEVVHGNVKATLSRPKAHGKDAAKQQRAGNRRGGMLMSPSNSGLWRDDYTQGDRTATRATKRSERQRVRAELAAWAA